MKGLYLMLVSALLLSGCQLTRVEGRVDDVDVKVSNDGHHDKRETNSGKFCPPGQAKKGAC